MKYWLLPPLPSLDLTLRQFPRGVSGNMALRSFIHQCLGYPCYKVLYRTHPKFRLAAHHWHTFCLRQNLTEFIKVNWMTTPGIRWSMQEILGCQQRSLPHFQCSICLGQKGVCASHFGCIPFLTINPMGWPRGFKSSLKQIRVSCVGGGGGGVETPSNKWVLPVGDADPLSQPPLPHPPPHQRLAPVPSCALLLQNYTDHQLLLWQRTLLSLTTLHPSPQQQRGGGGGFPNESGITLLSPTQT